MNVRDASLGAGLVVRIRNRLAGDVIAAVRPPGQVFIPAPLAAERPPPVVHRMLSAQDAQRSLAHPTHSNQFMPGDRHSSGRPVEEVPPPARIHVSYTSLTGLPT